LIPQKATGNSGGNSKRTKYTGIAKILSAVSTVKNDANDSKPLKKLELFPEGAFTIVGYFYGFGGAHNQSTHKS